MSDAALKNAEIKREEIAQKINDLLRELEDWKRKIARIDTFIKDWHEFAGAQNASPAVNSLIGPTGSPSSAGPTTGPQGGPLSPIPKTRSNSKKEDVAAAALEFIREAGGPIPRVNLLTLLINRGLIIHGGDPEVVLSTMLWRMRHKIIRLKKGGYWDAGRPSPDGSYVPGDNTDKETLGSMTVQERHAAMVGPEPDDPFAPSPDDLRDAQIDREIDEEVEKRAHTKDTDFFS